MTVRRLCLPLLLPLFTAVLAACGDTAPEWRGHDITGVMPDLRYTLTGENGETMTAGAYSGKVRLLFFGFTHCPDICPATLGRLKSAMTLLDAQQRERVRVLFVSVDPERDTPERLAEYTGYFGPRFVGLTGSQAQLTELTKRYRVTYGYGGPDENGAYTVSHSGAIFVFDPQGKVRLLFNQSVPVEDIAADLRRLLENTA